MTERRIYFKRDGFMGEILCMQFIEWFIELVIVFCNPFFFCFQVSHCASETNLL
jgi:hypothetical protein